MPPIDTPLTEIAVLAGTDADAARMLRVANQGCPEAFAQLIGEWRPRIERYCYRLCGNLADAEDLTQEIFQKLYRTRERYRPQAKFSTFLWQIATNHCRDFARAQRRRVAAAAQHQDWVESLPQEHTTAGAFELRESVQQAVWRLPEPYRAVLVLRHYEDLKFSEIAELLHVPRGTVASRMAKALRLVERELIRDRVLAPPPTTNTPSTDSP